MHGEGGTNETLVRYNVDGIELDATAFAQLHVELSMRRLTARDKESNRPEVLHAGTCADTQGENHLLVVRERRIKLWMGRQLLDANEDGRRYYEILTDPQLLARVAGRLATEEQKKATTSPGARQLQGSADVSSRPGERSHVR